VEYGYDETEVPGEITKGLRPTSVRYPNNRLVHYTYGTSASDADVLSRLDAIKDDSAGSPALPKLPQSVTSFFRQVEDRNDDELLRNGNSAATASLVTCLAARGAVADTCAPAPTHRGAP